MVHTYVRKEDPQHRIWRQLFKTENGRKKMSQPYPSRFAEALPGLYSGDPRFQAFLRDASEQLDEQINTNPIDRFAGPSGVSASFSRMRTACGVMGRPAGHVLYDNQIKRHNELKLTRDVPDAKELALLHELLDVMMSDIEPGPLKVAAKSSAGMPNFSYDKDEKIAAGIETLSEKNLDSILSHVRRKDGLGLLEKHNIVIAYAQNYRASPDPFGKVRYAPDFDYATSGGRKGKMVEIDKRVFDGNVLVDSIQGNRPRLVMGMNNPINLVVSTWRSGTARVYLKKYGYTWKHTSKEQICDDLNEYLFTYPQGQIIGVDVGQFDASVPTWIRLELYNYCKGRYISEELGDLMIAAAFAPVFQPETGDGMGAVMHGDPILFDQLPGPGLLSGFDMVSPEGKIFNVWQALCLIGHMMGFSYIQGNVKEFLLGKLSIRMKNAGDDGLIMFPSRELSDKFFSDQIMSKSFFKIEPEASLQFLGNVFSRQESGKIVAYNNLVSFMTGTFCPERPWNSKLRNFWNIGVAEKMKVYANNPSFEASLDILDRCMARRLPHLTDFRTYVNRLIVSNSHNKPELLSDYDSQFIMNPDAIHYKLDEDLVSPHLLDEVYGSIPLDAYEHMLGKHLLY